MCSSNQRKQNNPLGGNEYRYHGLYSVAETRKIRNPSHEYYMEYHFFLEPWVGEWVVPSAPFPKIDIHQIDRAIPIEGEIPATFTRAPVQIASPTDQRRAKKSKQHQPVPPQQYQQLQSQLPRLVLPRIIPIMTAQPPPLQEQVLDLGTHTTKTAASNNDNDNDNNNLARSDDITKVAANHRVKKRKREPSSGASIDTSGGRKKPGRGRYREYASYFKQLGEQNNLTTLKLLEYLLASLNDEHEQPAYILPKDIRLASKQKEAEVMKMLGFENRRTWRNDHMWFVTASFDSLAFRKAWAKSKFGRSAAKTPTSTGAATTTTTTTTTTATTTANRPPPPAKRPGARRILPMRKTRILAASKKRKPTGTARLTPSKAKETIKEVAGETDLKKSQAELAALQRGERWLRRTLASVAARTQLLETFATKERATKRQNVEKKVRCRCNFEQEKGTMVECSKCKSWVHAQCYPNLPQDKADLASDMPIFYCDSCKAERSQVWMTRQH